MGTVQYIGARYVPLLDGEWDSTKEYEPLTVVKYTDGNTYVSKKVVPAGTLPTNANFWMNTSYGDARIESLENRATAIENDIDGLQGDLSDLGNVVDAVNTTLQTETQNRTSADQTLQQNINAEVTARQQADTALGNRISSEITARISADDAIHNRITHILEDGIVISEMVFELEADTESGHVQIISNYSPPSAYSNARLVGISGFRVNNVQYSLPIVYISNYNNEEITIYGVKLGGTARFNAGEKFNAYISFTWLKQFTS